MAKSPNKSIQNVRQHLLDGMVRYMQGKLSQVGAARHCGYSQAHIDRCAAIVDAYLATVAPASKPSQKQILAAVKQAVLDLNSLNAECEGDLIETGQREGLGNGRHMLRTGVPNAANPLRTDLCSAPLRFAAADRKANEVVYDDHQHRDLFNAPGRYLFRGALPSSAFAGPYRGPGVTPTSTDPVVATLFACRYRMEGPAVVLVALKSDFAGYIDRYVERCQLLLKGG